MPLKIESISFKDLNRKPVGSYVFLDKYHEQWQSFWNEMGGDTESVTDWAKSASIEYPEEWCYGLYKFLFSGFAGDDAMLKTAASKSFQQFVGHLLQNHIKSPKARRWYIDKGITYTGFIDMLDRASEITDQQTLVAFIGARMIGFGNELYNEYLLGRAGFDLEAKIKASDLNYKAYCIESKHDDKPVDIGAEVKHQMYPDDKLEVVRIDEDAVWAINRKTGSMSYIEDVWNLEIN